MDALHKAQHIGGCSGAAWHTGANLINMQWPAALSGVDYARHAVNTLSIESAVIAPWAMGESLATSSSAAQTALLH